MRVAFYTLGCKVNQYETELMRESLINNGYEICSANDVPDIFIINSCTVTAESDRKTRQCVRRQRKKYPNAVIVLTGCMPQAFPDKADELECADIILGNGTNHELCMCLEEHLKTGRRIINVKPHDKEAIKQTAFNFHERTKAYLKIEDGCNRFCSYCIIPYARGRVRSKPLDSIVAETAALAQKGYKEIVLIGINLSAYGSDCNLTLADAVEAVAENDGIKRIRLGSMEPDQFIDETIERLAKVSKLCPQFHLSLQSGCDTTLKRMNRHYDTAFYYDLICRLRNKFEDCSITTDIMVGFAGESNEDFDKSVEFLKKVGFARSHVFAYSRRKGTKADLLPDQVQSAEKERRSKIMIAAADECMNSFLQTQIGNSYPVLFENRNKNGYFEGYTQNYTLVKVKTDINPCGKILNTKLIEINDDGCIGVIQ